MTHGWAARQDGNSRMSHAVPKKFTPLPRKFYQPSADVVALQLLGHWLIRRTKTGFAGGPIVETEAYLRADPACHGYPGCTERNRPMWGPPGFSYVYFIYGNHFCFNAVCESPGIAEAVLVRALEPTFGADLMQKNRPTDALVKLSNGPAKLCQALEIDRRLNAIDLCLSSSPVFIARNATRKKFLEDRGPVVTTTRVGISRAADLPLRFFLPGSPFVSRRL
jgi:DNA-3-methyladenine glycosylase